MHKSSFRFLKVYKMKSEIATNICLCLHPFQTPPPPKGSNYLKISEYVSTYSVPGLLNFLGFFSPPAPAFAGFSVTGNILNQFKVLHLNKHVVKVFMY